MSNRIQAACAVCGCKLPEHDGKACSRCGFESAGITLFAGKRSFETWQEDCTHQRNVWRMRLQDALAGCLSVNGNSVALCNPVTEELITVTSQGEIKRKNGVKQCSLGQNHAVHLLADGTAQAYGSNDRGQLAVGDLQRLGYVLADANCTYAVHKDGTTQIRTGSYFTDICHEWHNVQKIAAGNYHIAALCKDGTVRFAGTANAPKVFQRTGVQWRNMKDIAARTEGLIGLDNDGKVWFAGQDSDSRKAAGEWSDIAAIAMEYYYAVGLARDGSVRLAGKGSTILDNGRANATEWRDMIAIAAGLSVIAGIDMQGRLHLAGNIQRADTICRSWKLTPEQIAAFVKN